jgi:hypothetical protein
MDTKDLIYIDKSDLIARRSFVEIAWMAFEREENGNRGTEVQLEVRLKRNRDPWERRRLAGFAFSINTVVIPNPGRRDAGAPRNMPA